MADVRRRTAGAVVAAGLVVLLGACGGGEQSETVVVARVVGADIGDTAGDGAAERPRIDQVEPEEGDLTAVPPGTDLDADAHAGEPVDLSEHTVAGYLGWWSGDGHGEACDAYADAHPSVVLASTRTGAVVEAHTDGARLQRPPETPPGDPAGWPADSVVVLDAATGEVLESFEVDESGWRTDPPYVHCVPPSETP